MTRQQRYQIMETRRIEVSLSKNPTNRALDKNRLNWRPVVTALLMLSTASICTGSYVSANAPRANKVQTAILLARPSGYPSPDGRYVAVIVLTGGEAHQFTIYRLVHDRHGKVHRKPVIRYDDIDGFVWVPGKGHEAVIARSGVYDYPGLVLWHGGRHSRSLYHITKTDGGYFRLQGITRDGRTIIYYRAVDENDNDWHKRERRLTLPR
jgi:hypothetical protein